MSEIEGQPLKGKTVAIAGGSVSGLLVARAFENEGATVHAYERTRDDRPARGGALVIRPEGLEAMEQLGIVLPEGTLVRRRNQYLWGGTFERSWSSKAYTWDAVSESLRDHVSPDAFHEGKKVSSVTPDLKHPSLTIRNDMHDTADLIVIADGVGSPLRKSLTPDVPCPEYAGYVSYRGEIPWENVPHAQKETFDETLFELGDQWGLYNSFTFDRRDSNGKTTKRLTWSITLPQTPETVQEVFGDNYAESGLLPPGKICPSSQEYVHDLAKEHLTSYDRILPSIVKESDVLFARAIYDLPIGTMPEHIVFERTAVVGDAAYPVRPFSGRSTSKAAVDAVTLASYVSEAVEQGGEIQDGLNNWQADRIPELRNVANRARELDWRLGLPPYDPQTCATLDDVIITD